MRGLGPKSRAQLATLGVHSLSELREQDAVARERRTELLLRLDDLGLAPK